MQAGATEGFAPQVEGGVEQLQFALPVGHVHAEPFSGLAEAHAVLQVAGQEWRDMKRLGRRDMLVAFAAGREYVVVAFAPGVLVTSQSIAARRSSLSKQ